MMMTYKHMVKAFILLLGVVCLTVQSSQGNIVKEKNPYLGHIAWEIKPGGVWNEKTIKYTPAQRKIYSHDLYEEITPNKKPFSLKPGNTRDIYGLNISQYYLGWDEDNQNWVLMDMMCNVYSKIRIFYSPDSTYSRQKVVEEMLIDQETGSPVNRNRYYKWITFGQKIKAGILEYAVIENEDEKLCGIFFVEKGGYSLMTTGYWYANRKLKDKELFQTSEAILSALNGDRKFGYFPKRTRQLEKKRRERENMPYEKRSRLDDEARTYTKGMPEDIYKKTYWHLNVEKLGEILQMKMLDNDSKNDREMIPNINSSIGTLKWIKKYMNVPFVPKKGHDESHVNGLSGTFTIRENGHEYPVIYTILHLHTKEDAMEAMLGMQISEQSGHIIKPEILEKIVQINPRVVGDHDICLKPIINELGQPIPNGEHSWICFTRGNTAVMLKNEEMEISVLPLAKIIDEALHKNMELFMKPEEVL